MIRNIYKSLRKEDIEEGVIFTSTLSEHTTEQPGDTTHKVYAVPDDDILGKYDNKEKIARLKDNSFFKNSPWKYNIQRD